MNKATEAASGVDFVRLFCYNFRVFWDKCINEKAPLQGAIFKHTKGVISHVQ